MSAISSSNADGWRVPAHGIAVDLDRVFLLIGKNVQVLDKASFVQDSFRVLYEVNHDDTVRAVAVDPVTGLFATGGDDKKLRIFNKSDKLWEADTPKKVTQLVLAPGDDGVNANASTSPVASFLHRLLFADKFGSVYRACAFDANAEAKDAVPWLKSAVMGKSTYHDEIPMILGHYSTITQLIPVTGAGQKRFIVTTEKDEKIRVTSYPQTFNIVSYCLGHTKFVSCADYWIDGDNIGLISGGGDATLMAWDLVSGRRLAALNVSSSLLPSNSSSLTALGAVHDVSACIRRVVLWKQARVALVAVEEYDALLLVKIGDAGDLHLLHQLPLAGSVLDMAISTANELDCTAIICSGFCKQSNVAGSCSTFVLALKQDENKTVTWELKHLQSWTDSQRIESETAVMSLIQTLSPTLALRKIISTRFVPKKTEDGVPEPKRSRLE
jgi:WD40 repeat protein